MIWRGNTIKIKFKVSYRKMAIIFKNGDLFTSEANYLCHQVNCMGKMGSGIARTVRERFPVAYDEYKDLCLSRSTAPSTLLGDIMLSQCEKTVIHMFAQEKCGRHIRYTNYRAFRECLRKIRSTVPTGSTIAFPYGIGCGLGGGKWEVILPMIEEELSNDYEIEVWKYGI